jgi:glycine amidinotransferase
MGRKLSMIEAGADPEDDFVRQAGDVCGLGWPMSESLLVSDGPVTLAEPGRALGVAPRREAQTSPVCSYNEWDPLEEVIVGIVEGACFPPWSDVLAAPLPEDQHALWRECAQTPFPSALVADIRPELDGFVALLERRGVRVRRPERQDKRQVFGAPGWSSTGFYDAMPRDGFLVVGDEIIECPMAWRSRYFESAAYRPLFKEYFRRGARWSAAPKPELPDCAYEEDWRSVGADGRPRLAVSEFEPAFDAADIVRCGRDLFAQLSHVTNRFGIDWLRRHLGPGYRVHLLTFDDPHPMHIDATFMPIAPGKLLINPERVTEIPPMFAGWDVRAAPPPVIPDDHPMQMCSRWVNMNILMLDPTCAVVEAEDRPMRDLLQDWGIEVLTCPFRNFNTIGGSFHCATLDVRRQGSLQSYF